MLRSLAIVPVLAAAVLLFGCATPSGPPSNEGLPDRTTHANDSYFGVIDVIRSASPDGGAAGEKAKIHSIRIRYDESTKGYTMNWDIIEGDWKQFKGLVKQKWGRLTDDHLDTTRPAVPGDRTSQSCACRGVRSPATGRRYGTPAVCSIAHRRPRCAWAD